MSAWEGPFTRAQLPPDAGAALAQAEGMAIVGRIADRIGSRSPNQQTHAILDRWGRELGRRMAARETKGCGHLRSGVAEPMVWMVFAPELIRCRTCAADQCAATTGTPLDNECDGCGAVDCPELSVTIGVIGAGVMSYPDALIPIGPIIIQGAVCRACGGPE